MFFALLAVVALVAAAWLIAGGHVRQKARPVGLFTTLPIVWRESPSLGDLLVNEAPPHWARGQFETQGPLIALDTLVSEVGETGAAKAGSAEAGPGKAERLPLPRDALLVMAQPRALSPAENVALHDWVRAGGQVLLFADPMLTAPSAYALGDKRRPQDVALLSPILARWGLALLFDDSQPYGTQEVPLLGGQMPVNLPGRFALAPGNACALLAGGLAARCRVGQGEVLAVADAALLEDGTIRDASARRAMLARLSGVFSR